MMEEKEGMGISWKRQGGYLRARPSGCKMMKLKRFSEGWAVKGLKGHARRRAWAPSSGLRGGQVPGGPGRKGGF